MFSEDFQLLVTPGEAHWEDGDFSPAVIESVRAAIAELEDTGVRWNHEVTEVGRGASGIALLLTLGGIFLAGKKIDENVDAWLRIGSRLTSVIQKLIRLGFPPNLSEPAAAVLAMKAVIDKEPIVRSVRLLTSSLHVVNPVTWHESVHRMFRHVPERYYVYAVATDTDNTHIVCMRSDGRTEFHQILLTGNWHAYLGLSIEPPTS